MKRNDFSLFSQFFFAVVDFLFFLKRTTSTATPSHFLLFYIISTGASAGGSGTKNITNENTQMHIRLLWTILCFTVVRRIELWKEQPILNPTSWTDLAHWILMGQDEALFSTSHYTSARFVAKNSFESCPEMTAKGKGTHTKNCSHHHAISTEEQSIGEIALWKPVV